MKIAADNIGSDHFLHEVDVFKSMPELTRALTASLPPGSFVRDSFLSGLSDHSRKRRSEENLLTALKLATSLAAGFATSGFGIIGRLAITGATTTIGSLDAINNYRDASEVMRRGAISGGMNMTDWRRKQQQRSNDLVRDIVSLAGNAIGALPGKAAATASVSVQALAAGMSLVN